MPFCGLEAHIHKLQESAVHSVASMHLYGGKPLLLQHSNLCRCSPMGTLKFGVFQPNCAIQAFKFLPIDKQKPANAAGRHVYLKPSLSLSLSLSVICSCKYIYIYNDTHIYIHICMCLCICTYLLIYLFAYALDPRQVFERNTS